MDEATADKEVITIRADKSLAKLLLLAPRAIMEYSVLDRFAGQLTVPTDFDAPLPGEVIDAFEGR